MLPPLFQAYYTRKSGSIGQMLSHILLAERFKASDLSALLVFEDDALPPASVSQYAVFDARIYSAHDVSSVFKITSQLSPSLFLFPISEDHESGEKSSYARAGCRHYFSSLLLQRRFDSPASH